MARYNNSRKTWQYTEEFKAKVVETLEIKGAEEFDFNQSQLSAYDCYQ